jgi:dihydroorotate dehydrogenase electron transfer subunit
MPVDVDARVVENRRLSSDYNVLVFHAPAIAAAAAPGQFVMIKTAGSGDAPLLRRPFSIFQIVRDPSGAPSGISIINKRIGIGTSQLYDARAGASLPVLGPLGKPFVAPASGDAWMVAGGVGIGPFVTLAETLQRERTAARLFYGARTAADLHCADLFPPLGAELTVATEDGSRGDKGFITLPLERALETARTDPRDVTIYCCGPTPMRSWDAAWAAATAAS